MRWTSLGEAEGMDLSAKDLEITLNVLQHLADHPTRMNSQERLRSLIIKIYKQDQKQQKQRNQQLKASQQKPLIKTAELIKTPLNYPSISEKIHSIIINNSRKYFPPKKCYICQKYYTQIHHFYHLICQNCGDFNYKKRFQHQDLSGRTALVTGGRIKIGYQIALRLLQDGAKVIVTTRFPGDAIKRFSQEPDFEQWRKRLMIYGLDLRNLVAIESFIQHLINTEPGLDILINNAAQTIKRPLAFYKHLLESEQQFKQFPELQQQGLIALNSQLPILLEAQLKSETSVLDDSIYFPPNCFDEDGQQLDKRPKNSWRLKLNEVSTIELLEVQFVNAIAPFILNSKLKPLLMRSPFSQRFIINVSAMEGNFNRDNKTIFHPHTNMAKAALNMMTRTSAIDYAQDGIYMNSVDTGWITNENPYPQKQDDQQKRGFYPPLDNIDGMARIYDPIVQGIQNPSEPLFGHFLKNYVPSPW
ncbi:SDR family NAD(P)-dependent oxidoreductase [Planktothrix sp. FACHB-1365]|uniref:SDR family NAD(P)-dependent oxidoreductase n=1 Tax=Planktothrix sp. FACHB-1365 TaxID=2692855 RepID=UPI002729AB56|nr:SDR family oxidoreductase [Planktothrix sp. FACHB-1365]